MQNMSTRFQYAEYALPTLLMKNHNVSRNVISLADMQSWLSGQSGALSKREIAGSDPNGALLP